MSEKASISVLSFRARYLLHAYSAPARFSLRQVSELLINEKKERYNQDCLIVHRNNIEKIFIFRFGTIVFFNVAVEEHENYLSTLGMTPKKKAVEQKDLDELAEDDFTLTIEPGVTEVSFNAVKIPEFDLAKLEMVAHILAQSSALEIIEWEVEEFLAESDTMTRGLKRGGLISRSRSKLLKFIGEGLSARHRIVNQLLLLNEPEKTWEKEDLYKLYQDLFKNFDMKDRIDRLEKMLGLCSDVSELLLEVLNARRAEVMEIVIIILIGFELLKSLY
ncbi:MAG: RMD1 family protein [Deltaproteobacteria bacterium]|nr:RMD1 family protein [Deltaproteobacteria bacterium]